MITFELFLRLLYQTPFACSCHLRGTQKDHELEYKRPKKTVVLWIFHQNTTMPRHLRTVSFYFLSVAVLVAALAAGVAIAGEPGAAPDTYDMTAANWLMMLPLVLVLAAASSFATGLTLPTPIWTIPTAATHATPVLHYRPSCRLLPWPPASPCSMAWSPPTSVRPAAPTAVHCAG